MVRIVKTVFFALMILFFAIIISPFLLAQSAQTLDVHVRNFPEKQEVKGSVSIEGTASHSKFMKREGILVPPSRRNEFSELTFAGIVETDGFTSLSVNVQGEIKSGSFSSGTIGVLLIPDEDPVVRAFRETRRIAFPIEAAAAIKAGDSAYFDSEQAQQRVAFPRYRIYLYNSINKSAETNIYLYLSN